MLVKSAATPVDWRRQIEDAVFSPQALCAATTRIRETVHIVRDRKSQRLGVSFDSRPGRAGSGLLSIISSLGPIYPEWLGDRSFGEAHGVRFPYIVGEMARGIAGPKMVVAACRAGLLAFFGAAGLAIEDVGNGIHRIKGELPDGSGWGVNIIHQPHDPGAEQALVDLLLAHGVTRASASAYLQLTKPLVQYAAAGLAVDSSGKITRRNRLVPKVSRLEIAQLFLEPPPTDMLKELVQADRLLEREADLASRLPLVEDMTVEADSGGHTDNRPLAVLLPLIRDFADRIADQRNYPCAVRVGAAGGIGTPAAAAGAFAMGAAYILTGSINQATRDADTSDSARDLLGRAGSVDFAMAPAADMFELGVSVQVLKRGTLFAQRASQLYAFYRRHKSLDELSVADRAFVENEVFRRTIPEVWSETANFFATRDPALLRRALADARVKMALLFRWYLGMSSRWATEGTADRMPDYQLWAGPALGACNRWLSGSFMADPRDRTVSQLAYNILEGAATISRAQQLRLHGLPIPPQAFACAPRRLR